MNARASENYLVISSKSVGIIFGPRYIGDDFFLGPNLVSFNRTVVPLLELISKVNFHVETKILVSMSEEI